MGSVSSEDGSDQQSERCGSYSLITHLWWSFLDTRVLCIGFLFSIKPHINTNTVTPHFVINFSGHVHTQSPLCHSCNYTTFMPKFSVCSYPVPKVTTFNLKFSTNCKSEYQTERGLEFETGGTFFRQESATGCDLSVLAASLHKKHNGSLRVLDALCGCGIRSLRYLVEAEADFVVANDGNESYESTIVENLSRAQKGLGLGLGLGDGDERRRWVVTHLEANRVLTDYYLQKSFFDFVDVDSFGSDSSFLRSAIITLKLGGLLYITSTDGYSSGGHHPHHSLAAYGGYVRPMPYSDEVGLRMLIGGAAREAAVLGYHITPLFSYYAYHGPIFRVLFRLNRGKVHDSRHYGYIGYCHQCGNSHEFSWDELGQISYSCNMSKVSNSLVVSGPLWTGPLHDAAYLMDMLNLAKQWGWIGCDGKDSLEKLIKLMVDESDPKLPFGYIKLDEMASRAKINSPPLRTLMSAMHQIWEMNPEDEAEDGANIDLDSQRKGKCVVLKSSTQQVM